MVLAMALSPNARRERLKELATLFLRLGMTAFGGPAAHIALMRDEVVVRREWLTAEEFLDLVGATNLIPGPNSTEMAIHIGHRRGGFAGLVVSGVCFILPAAVVTLVLAWVYVRFGSLPEARGILYGVKPVIIIVVVQAILGLGRSALKDKLLGGIGVLTLGASLLGVHELALLLAAGTATMVARSWKRPGEPPAAAALQLALAPVGPATTASAVAFSPVKLFLVFLKIGSTLFGSGYVLLAFLRADLVDRLHWMTEKQLIDAVAVGQLTPGPVFSAATFIGYVVGGGSGAALATLGIFIPSFVFVAVSGTLIPRIRRSAAASAFLDGVNVASLALMTAVTWELGHAALVDLTTVSLAIASAVLLLRFGVSSSWLVGGGALLGVAIQALR